MKWINFASSINQLMNMKRLTYTEKSIILQLLTEELQATVDSSYYDAERVHDLVILIDKLS